MNLNKVQIRNFRSIRDQTLTFDRNLQVLVGINEAGKSNVLKAVSLLDEEKEIRKNDIRDPGHDEGSVSASFVNFIFNVESWISKKVFNNLKPKVLSKKQTSIILDIGDKQFTFKEFCEYKNEVFYVVNLKKQSRYMSHPALLGSKYRIHSNWSKVKKDVSFLLDLSGKEVDLLNYSIVNIKDYPEIPKDFLEELTIKELNKIVGLELTKETKDYIPRPILWKYNEENLLPGKIDYSQFVSSPSACIPLKNMFILAGYSEPAKALQEADEKTNGIRNILRKVSSNTTAHMQEVWPEWKNQKVTLFQNGGFIEAGIEDEYNIYSLSRRSDGFKRFFTFLLMISVQNKTEYIYDNLILIDEPDIGLHPSGVQYLREELKRISNNNLVLISTHSIFMIDKEIVDRHLIVEKKKEITEFRKVVASNITDEEVIYKALGYSLYEILRPLNIIFEGWRDKSIFVMFTRSKAGRELFNKANLSQIGFLHSMGVKDVGRVANTCENFSRKYIIITDSDKPAKEKKNKYDGQGEWLCYDDIDGISAITTEDFISNKLINSSVKHVMKINGVEETVVVPLDVVTDKILYLSKLLSDIGLEKDKIKSMLNSIKEHICENTKASDLDKNYSNVCSEIMKKLTM
ncbi:MAG: ATP-binding protein [Gammaproteobacteria bacterium]|nr:ATP-binding protein [Gammaproteobacteria bacterium]